MLERLRQIQVAVARDIRQDGFLRLFQGPPCAVAVVCNQRNDLVDGSADVRLLPLHARDVGKVFTRVAGSHERHQVVAVDDRRFALGKAQVCQIVVGHDNLHGPDRVADQGQGGAVGDHVAVDGDPEQQIGDRPAQVFAAHLAAVAIGVGKGQVIDERSAVLAVDGILVDARHGVAVQRNDRDVMGELIHHDEHDAVRPRGAHVRGLGLDVRVRVNAGVEDRCDAVVVAILLPVVFYAPVTGAHVSSVAQANLHALLLLDVFQHPHSRENQHHKSNENRYAKRLVLPYPSLEPALEAVAVMTMVMP